MPNATRILNLGCGGRPLKGAVNHDRMQFAPHVDVWWELEEPLWSVKLASQVAKRRIRGEETWGLFDDRSDQGLFDEIHARDVLEHIRPHLFYQTMNEAWNMLETGGLFYIQVPQWGSHNARIDPTHWRGFELESFDYLDPATRLGRAGWTTDLRWKIMDKAVVPRTKTNLTFTLKKIL